MKAFLNVDAGVCGFRTEIRAESDDSQFVTFGIASPCGKVGAFGDALQAGGPVDAYLEIGAGSGGAILPLAREILTGCCAACVVPCAVFKAMQVAAGLALPRNIGVEMSKES